MDAPERTDGDKAMRLQTVRAIYRDGGLLFLDPTLAPEDGTEVVVTFLEKPQKETTFEMDPIQALRGRGKGEGLVEKLLKSRREDRDQDEQHRSRLRA